jgi:hypothetical protein
MPPQLKVDTIQGVERSPNIQTCQYMLMPAGGTHVGVKLLHRDACNQSSSADQQELCCHMKHNPLSTACQLVSAQTNLQLTPPAQQRHYCCPVFCASTDAGSCRIGEHKLRG